MNKVFTLAILSAAVTLSACTSTGGLLAGATGLAAGVLSPSGVDPDYDAYLDACKAQFDAQQKTSTGLNTSLVGAIGQATDPTARGSLIMLAAIQSQKPAVFKCDIQRKIGFVEGMTSSGLVGAGIQLYGINRQFIAAKRQLEASNEQFRLTTEDNAAARTDMNQFWGGLIGTYEQRKPEPVAE